MNKNSVRGDTSAVTPGGIRLGTPAMTTRGMKEEDMQKVADLIHEARILAEKIQQSSASKKMLDFIPTMESEHFVASFQGLKQRVEALATRFPLPGLKP